MDLMDGIELELVAAREIDVRGIFLCSDWRDFLPASDPELQLWKVHWRKSWVRYFYSYLYLRLGDEGHPAFINAAKNDRAQNVFSYNVPAPIPLVSALRCVNECFRYSLPKIAVKESMSYPIGVCIVPRAKRDEHYYPNQLGIKRMLQLAIRQIAGFVDLTNAIERVSNVPTTHGEHGAYKTLPRIEVPASEPDFMSKSCRIDPSLWDKVGSIILVDDLYTAGNPIDRATIKMIAQAHPDVISGRLDIEQVYDRMALYTLGVTKNYTFHSRVQNIEEIK